MNVHELLQRVVREALESGDYSEADVRENVDVAIESYAQYVADADED